MIARTRPLVVLVVATLAIGSGVACGGSEHGPSGPPLVGAFGYQPPPNTYEASTVTATSSSASFVFECLKGQTGPIVLDSSGAFSIQGSLTTTGGAITTYPDVTFSGTVTADTLVFSASWNQPYMGTYGPVTMVKDVTPTGWPGCI